MTPPTPHPHLLATLTLGTTRRPVPEELSVWLDEHDVVDPTADGPERLLAAYAVSERLHRLSPGGKGSVTPVVAPPEDWGTPGPRLARALELILRDTYPAVLPEAVDLLLEKQTLVPPHLLPELLTIAEQRLDARPAFARKLLAAGGKRALWLAGQNPEWAELAPDYDLAAAWARDTTPGRRANLLRRWRMVDSVAAREALAEVWPGQSPKNQETLLGSMAENLSPADVPWLRAGLTPKRKGVRRAILRLLILAGDEETIEDMIRLVTAAVDDQGKLTALLKPGPEYIELLQRYGGLKKGESLAVFLLAHLPPGTLPELTDRPEEEFWASLNKEQLKAAATALHTFPAPALRAHFIRFALRANPANLPMMETAMICGELPQEAFVSIFNELLTTEQNALHYGGVARVLALSRKEIWSERLSKAFVLQLVSTLREIGQLPYKLQRDLQEDWKGSIALLDPAIFGWLRTHLHSMTERADVFGKLATETLQTLAFRRVLRE